MHTYTHTYICTHIHTHIHMHTYIRRKEMFYLTMHSTHFYVWIYSVSTYIHIHMHTYMHAHTYIYTQLLMRDPLNYFSFQPVFHNWCSKGLWDDAYKRTLAANWKEYPILQQRVSSRFLSSPLPYVLCYTRK